MHRLGLLIRECILEYPAESHAENLDAALWRHCYHGPIDYYRKFLKGPKTAEGRWAIAEVNRLIDAGYAFFATLLYELLALGSGGHQHGQHALIRETIFSTLGLPVPRPGSERIIAGLDGMAYRLLLCCGDLARYRWHFNRSFQEDRLKTAMALYEAARRWEPEQGHAANQLAVANSLRGGEVVRTIYWYLRGEYCAFPFSAARSNLLAYLGKMSSLGERGGRGPSGGGGNARMDAGPWSGLVQLIRHLLLGTPRWDGASEAWLPSQRTQEDDVYLLLIFLTLSRLLPDEQERICSLLSIFLDMPSLTLVLSPCLASPSLTLSLPSCPSISSPPPPEGASKGMTNHPSRILLLMALIQVLRSSYLRSTLASSRRESIVQWIIAQGETIRVNTTGTREALYELVGFELFDDIRLSVLLEGGTGAIDDSSKLVPALLMSGLTIPGVSMDEDGHLHHCASPSITAVQTQEAGDFHAILPICLSATSSEGEELGEGDGARGSETGQDSNTFLSSRHSQEANAAQIECAPVSPGGEDSDETGGDHLSTDDSMISTNHTTSSSSPDEIVLFKGVCPDEKDN